MCACVRVCMFSIVVTFLSLFVEWFVRLDEDRRLLGVEFKFGLVLEDVAADSSINGSDNLQGVVAISIRGTLWDLCRDTG